MNWVTINHDGVTVMPEDGKCIIVRYVLPRRYSTVNYCILRAGGGGVNKFCEHDTHWCYITPPDGEKE